MKKKVNRKIKGILDPENTPKAKVNLHKTYEYIRSADLELWKGESKNFQKTQKMPSSYSRIWLLQ